VCDTDGRERDGVDKGFAFDRAWAATGLYARLTFADAVAALPVCWQKRSSYRRNACIDMYDPML
jgi:hypothetical protein